jgi:SNF2 family DNA or RNA helicase
MPPSLLEQWKSEFETLGLPKTRVFINHGTNRLENIGLYNIVLTTYSTLSSEFEKRSKLMDIEWHRVILDEAHYIKNSKTKKAEACFALKATHKWCITGTPIQNTIEDLYSLVYFVGVAKFKDFKYFKKFFKTSDQKVQNIHRLFEEILLRRLKIDEIADSIPLKKEQMYHLEFSDFEKEYYENYSQNYIKTHKEDDSCLWMLVLLLRSKQICNHISATKDIGKEDIDMDVDDEDDLINMFGKLTMDEKNTCKVCSSKFEIKLCISVCRKCFDKLSVPERFEKLQEFCLFSTKIDAIVMKIRDNYQKGLKTIVYSQFTKALDLLGNVFELMSLKYVKCMRLLIR